MAAGVDQEFADDAQAILIFQQRSLARRKFLGKHGKVAYSGIDRGCLFGGVLIDRGLFGDECIYVGDANQNLYVTVGQAFGNFDLIRSREVSLSIDDHSRVRRSRTSLPAEICGGWVRNSASCCWMAGGKSGSNPCSRMTSFAMA